MILLSREATENDHSLKTKLRHASNMTESEANGEIIWPEDGYFSDQRADFNVSTKFFLENSLVHLNKGTISTIKDELAIYVNCFILGQITPALNSPPDIYLHQCKQSEVKIVPPMYDLYNGKLLGLEKRLGYIMLRGDPDEVFFHMVLVLKP